MIQFMCLICFDAHIKGNDIRAAYSISVSDIVNAEQSHGCT